MNFQLGLSPSLLIISRVKRKSILNRLILIVRIVRKTIISLDIDAILLIIFVISLVFPLKPLA